MTAKSIPQLKTAMPFNSPGGTTIQDMHDFIDTVDARSFVSVKQFGAVGTEVISSDTAGRTARALIDTQAFLDATAAANGTSCVYVPAGYYYVNANQWIIPTRMKVEGDGTLSRITKIGSGFLLDVSGYGDFIGGDADPNDAYPSQTRNNAVILRDLFFHGSDNSGPLLRTYYASELLIDKCRFAFNGGPAIDAVEWWDSRVQNCFFDWCGNENTENPVVYLKNSLAISGPYFFGYSRDGTNQIYFTGCRFESFKSHAIKFNQTEAIGTDHLYGIYITNCKFETHYLAGSILKFSGNNEQSQIHLDNIYISVNEFNEDSLYSTSTDLIDWDVNNGCSIRNVWVHIGTPVSSPNPLVRTVVRSNCSFNSNTIENVFVSGAAPSYGVLEANGGTDPQLMGFIGGISNGIGATAIVEHAGGFRAITGATTAFQSHNGNTYTSNVVGGNIDVTIPANVWPGWTCRALQLNTGTITFIAASGVTFLYDNGANHRRTAGAGTMMNLIVTSNTDAATAAVCHVSGKTVAAP